MARLAIRAVVMVGRALRLLPIPAMQATDSGLAGIAYDLLYATEASLWRARSDMPTWPALEDAWRERLAAIDKTVPDEPSPLPTVRLIANNAEAYARRSELYALATRSIDVSTYAIYGDDTGWRTVAEIVARAKAGVRVRVQVDDGICIRKDATTPDYSRLLDALRDGGVTVSRYRDPSRPYDMNHRKLLILDGETALIGGRNYGDPYAGDLWRDVELEVTGALAHSCQAVFDAGWERQENGAPLAPPPPLRSIADGLGRCVEIRGDTSRDNPILLWQLAVIDAATHSVDIENAYVVMHDVVRERLLAAVQRGVRVRLLTNSIESNDVKTAAQAFFRRFPPLVDGGVELWLRQGAGKTVHSKYLVVDERFVSLGSYNWNAHSARFATETNLHLDHRPVARELTAFFEAGLAEAVRVHTGADVVAMTPTDPAAWIADRVFLDFD